ncbi:hypothetical protein V0R37_15205 [Pollutimonas sp. H1-120]|uniref:hypothetical protein n=1 Tax=Pollutimonas sp. H1-120 TaxID=3148824 RepID=UPI003B5251CD
MMKDDCSILRHPNAGGSPVINPRIRGRKKGVPTLAMARRKKVADALKRESGSLYGRRYDEAKEKALQSPDAGLLTQLKELQAAAMGLFTRACDLEHSIVRRHDSTLLDRAHKTN